MKQWFLKSDQSDKNKTVSVDSSEQNMEKIKKTQLGYGSLIAMIKPILLHGLTWLLLIGFACYVKHETTLIKQLSQVSIARQADILSTLNDLTSQVSAIKADHQQIMVLKTELTQLEQTMATEQSLSGLAKSTELQQLATQLKQLQKTLHLTPNDRIQKTIVKKLEALPFQVKSIDMMAGQPFASITYHQDTLPLRLNDSLAGWKVVQMDYADGVAVWENADRRRIKIAVSRSMHG